VKARRPVAPHSKIALWRRRSFEVLTSDVVASHALGPEPPAEWAPHLRRLVKASRAPIEGPSWWTPLNAYFGNVETRTDPTSYYWDGMKRLGPRDRRGRSLREFDLQRRMMRYPCSYMIYTPSFDALPPTAKDQVYRRMWERLSKPDGRAAVEILRETKPDLPAYFLTSSDPQILKSD